MITSTSLSASGRMNISAGEDFFQTSAQVKPTFADVWLLAETDETVDAALHYYTDEANWFNLYKIYEVVEQDTTIRNVNLVILNQDRAKNFTYSANHFKASKYDARHFSKKFEKMSSKPTKRTALSLREAKEFIDDLLIEWLKTKL